MEINHMVFLAAETTKDNLIENRSFLYTILSIGIVLALFIVISCISLFKYISRLEKAVKKMESVVDNKETTSETTPIAAEELGYTDDLELVAVITAAIQAYEESKGNSVSENGLFVRSIRKVNKSRWQNA